MSHQNRRFGGEMHGVLNKLCLSLCHCLRMKCGVIVYTDVIFRSILSSNSFKIDTPKCLLSKRIQSHKHKMCTPTSKNLLALEDLIQKDKAFEDIESNLEEYQDILLQLAHSSTQKQYQLYNTLMRRSLHVKKSILNYVYRRYGCGETLTLDQDNALRRFLQKVPARNLSGVTVVTVLTAPFPDGQKFSCKHDCYYCPAEPNQPRSYLMREPAVARANRNEFDARRQTLDRLDTLLMNGHEIDKIEFILEGGTYTEYPVDYLERFMRDLVYTVNVYFETVNKEDLREPLSIQQELKINRDARVKISGICVETRPDCLLYEPEWLIRFRAWGVTRVQLGVQHICDHILEGVNRGHTAEQASRAIEMLKNNGFKVDIHLMPDLPGTAPDMDEWMFRQVYTTPHFQADQIKVYPCQVVPWTRIEKWHKAGKYVPYAETDWEGFMEVIKTAIVECPPWVRLPRVVRDIPMNYVSGGNDKPNLRQMITDQLKKEGRQVMEIRARESARHPQESIEHAEYVEREYKTTTGTELFLSIETPKALFGFCRLRYPPTRKEHRDGLPMVFNELKNKALIRELHVYGQVTRVGTRGDQHRGIGSILLKYAEQLAWVRGYDGVAVISGCGVEGYYAKRGYTRSHSFMIKRFKFTIYEYFAFVAVFMIIGFLFM